MDFRSCIFCTIQIFIGTILSIILLTMGLWNAGLTKNEKGFYAMSFVWSMFSPIAVQKYKGHEAGKE